MKLASILIVSFFIAILLINVETAPIRKGLARQSEKDYTLKEILNDGAESSVNPQTQKYKETLKPKVIITKKDTDNGGNKVDNKRKYKKEYYQEYFQNYRKLNKEKIKAYQQNYHKSYKEK